MLPERGIFQAGRGGLVNPLLHEKDRNQTAPASGCIHDVSWARNCPPRGSTAPDVSFRVGRSLGRFDTSRDQPLELIAHCLARRKDITETLFGTLHLRVD
jgi:hypothetical protein